MLPNRYPLSKPAFFLSLLVLAIAVASTYGSVFKDELENIFGDDEALKDSLIKYLSIVPASHKSRTSAMRIVKECKCDAKKDLQEEKESREMVVHKKKGGKDQNHLIAVVGAIFELAPEDTCQEECPTCPDKPKKCISCTNPCPNQCTPCPIPAYCPIPQANEKCPLKPECPPCDLQTTTTTTSTSTSTTTPSPDTTSSPTMTTIKDPLKTEKEFANVPRNLPVLSKQAAELVQRGRDHFIKQMGAKSLEEARDIYFKKIGQPRSSSWTTKTNEKLHKKHTSHRHNKTTATIYRNNGTFNLPALVLPNGYSTTFEVSSTSNSDTDDDNDNDLKPGVGTKTYNFNNSSTTLKNVVTNADGSSSVTVTTTTTAAASLTGTYLFEKNLDLLVPNKTVLIQIQKMIDAIPNTVGGEEMVLAERLLKRFGESKTFTTNKKGFTRPFTYLRAQSDVRCILGHLLEAFRRNRCQCEICPLPELCACKEPENCPKSINCPTCPLPTAPCPAPSGCPSFPACKPCNKPTPDDDEPAQPKPDDDGKVELLDDVDSENPVTKKELKSKKTCKGYTCKYQKTCGKAPLNPVAKDKKTPLMTNGENATYGEWPSFARLEISLSNNTTGLCGGVLISKKHVLTAGHCVKTKTASDEILQIPPESITVHLADHSKRTRDDFEQEVKVSSICRSSKFSDPKGEGSRYDFSVLTLAKSVSFDDHIQPACLPYEPVRDDKTSQCYVVGLGAIRYSSKGSIMPSNVQKMRVVRASCKDWGIRHDDRSRHCFTKHDYKGDTCGGDSGGPILCLNKANRWTAVGLVSYGSESCDGSEMNGWVAVYSRLPALMEQLYLDCKV